MAGTRLKGARCRGQPGSGVGAVVLTLGQPRPWASKPAPLFFAVCFGASYLACCHPTGVGQGWQALGFALQTQPCEL